MSKNLHQKSEVKKYSREVKRSDFQLLSTHGGGVGVGWGKTATVTKTFKSRIKLSWIRDRPSLYGQHSANNRRK